MFYYRVAVLLSNAHAILLSKQVSGVVTETRGGLMFKDLIRSVLYVRCAH